MCRSVVFHRDLHTAIVTTLALLFWCGIAVANPHVDLQNQQLEVCLACHTDPNGATNDVWIPVASPDQETVCLSCHNPTGQASNMSDVAVHRVSNGATTIYCATCHNPHGAQNSTDPGTGITAPNLKLIRNKITNLSQEVPAVIDNIVFQQVPTDYAKATAPYNGICNACHSGTLNHQNGTVPGETSNHSHNMGAVCTGCHTHKEGFQPRGAGDCNYCHTVDGFATNYNDGYFQTSGQHRRPILGADGDYQKTSHHVRGDIQISDCKVCHDLSAHSQGVVKLKNQDDSNIVYDYDPNNKAGIENFCLSCHDDNGSTIGGGLTPFSDGETVPNVKAVTGSGSWANAAHKTRGYVNNGNNPLTCLGDGSSGGCHINGHASDNEKLLKLNAGLPVKDLCLNCHTSGGVVNDAVSGSALATSIADAFNLGAIHNLGTTLTVGSYTFELQCTSCHNPHMVTGKYWDAATGQTPVTRPDFSRPPTENPRAMGYTLWGDDASEKADAYAGSGTYRTPSGESFAGSEMPDYASFCLDCHGTSGMPAPDGADPNKHGGINWAGDPHGQQSANISNGEGTCPDWYGCGRAQSWDGDACLGLEADCWPVMNRGKGAQAWTRAPFNAEERFAGANFVLQCINCHEAHGSSVASMIRPNPNNGTGTTTWNTMCNNCHWYYTDWHAGMSCGNASCHVSSRMSNTGTSSIHQMSNSSGAGYTKTFNSELVVDMRFESNLNDSGTWNLDGRWFDTAGSYAAGKFGNAIVLNGDQPVEVGSRNSTWSTDEGAHGTWKYTEMKYNMTLEAWVYPTSDANDENIIMGKHTYTDGGYAFLLKKIGGTLRAALMTNVNTGGANGVWDSDCNGLRGAFSTTPIPLNMWSHVAVTYDAALPDRDSDDGSVGRIRVYVNGEDVTDSYASTGSCYAQPGAGESFMTPYSMLDSIDPARCYNGSWCASALSMGGVMWGAGGRKGLIGRLDEAKVWNITKPASYFATADSQTAPRLTSVGGSVGSNVLVLTYSEGVRANGGGALTITDFNYVDADNGRTIVAVSHTEGSDTVTITLSSPLDSSNDLLVDSIAGAVYDEYGNATDAGTATVTQNATCPSGAVDFELNEAAGSAYVSDSSGNMVGAVSNAAATIPGDGTLTGDGVSANFATFTNDGCMQAATAMTLESRFYIPAGAIPADTSTAVIQRILARDGGGNYQLSVWRSATTADISYPMVASTASLAFWVAPNDTHGGFGWKTVLTDPSTHPITNGHWYRVKAVWNTNKTGGTVGSPFLPADIFVDDEGTDGLGAGELWSGFRNATHTTQSWMAASRQFYTNDEIRPIDGGIAIGVNVSNNNNNRFNGKIDYIRWSNAVDYSGVDDTPIPPQ
jgi:hypothetical protein